MNVIVILACLVFRFLGSICFAAFTVQEAPVFVRPSSLQARFLLYVNSVGLMNMLEHNDSGNHECQRNLLISFFFLAGHGVSE